MLRWIGMVMMITGSVGFGRCLVGKENERRDILRHTIHILNRIVNEIEYGKRTVEEICFLLACSEIEGYGEFFEEIYQKSKGMYGVSFGRILDNALQNKVKTLPLHKEERRILLELPSKVLLTDESLQLLELRQGIHALGDALGMAEKEAKEKNKVVMGLSVVTGVFLVILFI